MKECEEIHFCLIISKIDANIFSFFAHMDFVYFRKTVKFVSISTENCSPTTLFKILRRQLVKKAI